MALVSIETESPRRLEATRPVAVANDTDLPWAAALDALACGERRAAPPSIWSDVVAGNLDSYGEMRTSGYDYALARRSPYTEPRRALTDGERELLRRVFGGDQQKAVAADLAIACSTASKWHTQALKKLRLLDEPVPLPLVIAAQSWTRDPLAVLPAGLDGAEFEDKGCTWYVLVVKRAAIPQGTTLTAAEQEVVRLLVEGKSRLEIADCRATSTQTVACQLRGVFAKLRATGRYALVRRAVELGWFE